MPSKLPEDSVLLREHYIENLSLSEIGRRYGVNKSNVSRRFQNMRRPHGGNAALNYSEYLPWQISRDYLDSAPALMLYAHIRHQAGIEIPEGTMKRLRGFWTKLNDGLILAAAQAESPPGLKLEYVPRRLTDGRLVVRWPDDAQPIKSGQVMVLALPEEW
ncbi:hypothetical protein E6W39_19120 [Kitasatospora acidiphila]|uniref:Uncharacterized protein n=1 Tax=Kitasatospora acidiphila TaxID=2567942 RepID=A0A540W4R1_9ACTN|nr:hypothetical protein [Kitasatospora acidiphila]TQF03963.1 hypothetical protein E6W39_19120 [Kitasatospora acidiphila]